MHRRFGKSGGGKAAIAIAHTLIVVIWHVLHDGAEYRDGFPGIARAVLSQHVRHPVNNLVRRLRLANGAETVGAGRVRRMPGAGRINDGIGSYRFGSLPVPVSDFERRGLAAAGLEFVEADTADLGDAA